MENTIPQRVVEETTMAKRWWMVAGLLLNTLISLAALYISLTHSGPIGPTGAMGMRGFTGSQGPMGPPGKQANAIQLRYGICWTTSYDPTYLVVSNVTISSPQINNGVYQCPQNETFVSIQPGPLPPNGTP